MSVRGSLCEFCFIADSMPLLCCLRGVLRSAKRQDVERLVGAKYILNTTAALPLRSVRHWQPISRQPSPCFAGSRTEYSLAVHQWHSVDGVCKSAGCTSFPVWQVSSPLIKYGGLGIGSGLLILLDNSSRLPPSWPTSFCQEEAGFVRQSLEIFASHKITRWGRERYAKKK